MEKKIRKIANALCEKINALGGWTAKYNIVKEDDVYYTNFMFQHYDEETNTETLVGDLVDSDLTMLYYDTVGFAIVLDEQFDEYNDSGEYTDEQLQLISDLFDNIKFYL